MYYIDDYNSKTVSNNPPKKKMLDKLKKINQQSKKEQLNAFWKVVGVTIAENFEDVQELLARYGYRVVNEEDAAVAIADIWKTPKWLDFVKELSILVESTVDEKLVENLLPNTDESSWVAAVIGAVGALGGGALGLAQSKQQAAAASENAKAQMIAAVEQARLERERMEAERLRIKSQEKRTVVWVIGILVALVVIAIIVAIIVRNRRQKQ